MNYKISNKNTLAFVTLLFCVAVFSQQEAAIDQEQRLESWNGVTLNYQLFQNTNLSVEGQARLKSYGETYKASFIEAQAEYEPFPFLAVGSGYRNSDKLDDVGKKQGNEKYDRFFGFLKINGGLGRLDFGLRLLHQIKKQRKVLENPKDNTRWRFKFSSGYNFPNWKLDPSIGVEFFMLNDFYDPNAYDKFRFSLGTKRKLNYSSSISVKYIHQQDVKIENPLSFNIFSVNYNYTIKSKK